jgi:hypothetical protein
MFLRVSVLFIFPMLYIQGSKCIIFFELFIILIFIIFIESKGGSSLNSKTLITKTTF